jgi:hypothetical protein
MNSSTKQGARRRVAPVVLAAALLVGGANIGAFAANGHAFLLGTRHVAGKTTTFVNHSSGPVLSLKGKKSSPPLKVNSHKKVTHLNADKVDGRNAESLANTGITYQLGTSNGGAGVKYTFPGLPAGAFLISYNVNRSIKASGKAVPRMTCAVSATTATKNQLVDVTPPGAHATANATGILRVDGTASLGCTVQGGSFVSAPTGPLSQISFLKVDRQAAGQASRVAAR